MDFKFTRARPEALILEHIEVIWESPGIRNRSA